jgi:hypothetical protein
MCNVTALFILQQQRDSMGKISHAKHLPAKYLAGEGE